MANMTIDQIIAASKAKQAGRKTRTTAVIRTPQEDHDTEKRPSHMGLKILGVCALALILGLFTAAFITGYHQYVTWRHNPKKDAVASIMNPAPKPDGGVTASAPAPTNPPPAEFKSGPPATDGHKRVAIMVDNPPCQQLDELRQMACNNNAKLTVFVTAQAARACTTEIERLRAEGHDFGTRGFETANFKALAEQNMPDDAVVKSQVTAVTTPLSVNTLHYEPKLFEDRLMTDGQKAELAKLGFVRVSGTTPDKAKDGDVVIGWKRGVGDPVASVAKSIHTLRSKGFEFATISSLDPRLPKVPPPSNPQTCTPVAGDEAPPDAAPTEAPKAEGATPKAESPPVSSPAPPPATTAAPAATTPPKREDGAACAHGLQCQSGKCVEDQCVSAVQAAPAAAPKANTKLADYGEHCQKDADCQSGFCNLYNQVCSTNLNNPTPAPAPPAATTPPAPAEKPCKFQADCPGLWCNPDTHTCRPLGQ